MRGERLHNLNGVYSYIARSASIKKEGASSQVLPTGEPRLRHCTGVAPSSPKPPFIRISGKFWTPQSSTRRLLPSKSVSLCWKKSKSRLSKWNDTPPLRHHVPQILRRSIPGRAQFLSCSSCHSTEPWAQFVLRGSGLRCSLRASPVWRIHPMKPQCFILGLSISKAPLQASTSSS